VIPISSSSKYSNIYIIRLRVENNYILESLLGAPPVTLATRRRASSAFNSFNWVERSDFDLSLNSWTLILAVHGSISTQHNKKILQEPNTSNWNDNGGNDSRVGTYPWRLRALSDSISLHCYSKTPETLNWRRWRVLNGPQWYEWALSLVQSEQYVFFLLIVINTLIWFTIWYLQN